MTRNDLNHRLPDIVRSLVDSVLAEPRMKHLDRVYLPNRDAIIKGIDLLRQLIFPGYFGKQGITTDNLAYRLGELSFELIDLELGNIAWSGLYEFRKEAQDDVVYR